MRERGLNLVICNVIFLLLVFSGVFVYLTPLLFFYISKRFSILRSFIFSLIVLLEFLLVFVLIDKSGVSQPLLQKIFTSFSWIPGFAYYDFFGIKGVAWSMGYYWITLVSVGLMLAYESQFSQKWFSLVFKVSAFAFVLIFALTVFLSKGNFVELSVLMEKYLAKGFDLILQMPKQFETEDLLYLKTKRDLILKALVMLFPGFIFCFLLFLVSVCEALSKLMFRTLFEVKTESFGKVVLPFVWIWLFIVNLALLMLNAYTLGRFELEAILTNFLIIFAAAFFFQGLAVLHYYLKRFALDTWILVLGYLSLLLVFQPFALVLSLIGILDAWFDFRKLNVLLPKA